MIDFKSFRILTYRNVSAYPTLDPRKMAKSVSKQVTLSFFRMNTYEKGGRGGTFYKTYVPNCLPDMLFSQRSPCKPHPSNGSANKNLPPPARRTTPWSLTPIAPATPRPGQWKCC